MRSGHLELRIEVDGGIADDTIAAAAEAGADAFVAGTAIYGAQDPAEAIRRLRALADAVLIPSADTARAVRSGG